jgi:hypothetical protein
VLETSSEKILGRLSETDRVLDVGGWAKPFRRADSVIDLMPYETRGLYDYEADPSRERFGPDSWHCRDICDREPWPFADDEFDFVICSHTLEDIRDPIYVCSEIVRVGKAGYIEVPSRLEEQSHGVAGDYAGWSHHRWLVDIGEAGIEFVAKPHVMHARHSDQFPREFWEGLSPEQRVRSLWWEGGFAFRERVMMEAAELDAYLADFVTANDDRPRRRRWWRR